MKKVAVAVVAMMTACSAMAFDISEYQRAANGEIIDQNPAPEYTPSNELPLPSDNYIPYELVPYNGGPAPSDPVWNEEQYTEEFIHEHFGTPEDHVDFYMPTEEELQMCMEMSCQP